MKVNKFCFYIFEFCGAPSLAMFGCFHVFIILNAKTTKGLIKRKQKAWDCDLKKNCYTLFQICCAEIRCKYCCNSNMNMEHKNIPVPTSDDGERNNSSGSSVGVESDKEGIVLHIKNDTNVINEEDL